MGLPQLEAISDLGFPKIGPPLKSKRSEAPDSVLIMRKKYNNSFIQDKVGQKSIKAIIPISGFR